MPLFKLKPSIADGEKSRIEFYLQQISQCIGGGRFQLDVLNSEALLYHDVENSTLLEVEALALKIGKHLSHDVGNIAIAKQIQSLEKCGGGGG